jgi:hypothetical protein
MVAQIVSQASQLQSLNAIDDWREPLQEIYERWIARFEKPRLKALSDLKQRLEKANG